MKKILILLILLLTVTTSQAAWYDTNYSHFKAVTINHEYVNGTVTNHTLLINITDTDLRDKAQSDGDDIIFVNAANTTQLDHQIESTFNSTTGHLIAWVRIPSITTTSDTAINMYYNYSGATNSENPSGVWGVNASGVWLMDEGTGTWANDSSSNTNNGSLENMADPPTTSSGWNASGKIDGGMNFDGDNDYVITNKDWDFTASDSFTLSTWAKSNGSGTWDYYSASGQANEFWLSMRYDRIIWSVRTSVGTYLAYYPATISNDWYYIVGTRNSTDGKIKLYINGVNVSHNTVIGDLLDVNNNFQIGRSYWDSDHFNGFIDSVRIYNRSLSAAEIATTYNNTNDPANFSTMGAEQSQSAAGGAPSITSYVPLGTIWPEVHDSQLFNVTVNQTTQCRWYVNGSLVQTNATPSLTHAYTNASLNGGGCNVTAVVNNTNGIDIQTWLFEVGADSVTWIILKDQPTNQTLIAEWNVTRIGSNVTDWGFWQNHTFSGWQYFFRYTNGIEIMNQTAASDNEPLWFNGTSLLPVGIYFINATSSYNDITLTANEHGILRKNVTSAETFGTIAAGIDHDQCYTWWNSTSDRWESYRVGYSYNAGLSIPKNDSYFVLMDGTGTTISCDIAAAETIAIPTGWYTTYLREDVSKTLTAIKADMGGNCVDLYAFNSSMGSWTDTGAYTVLPNEGLMLNASAGFNWDGAVP